MPVINQIKNIQVTSTGGNLQQPTSESYTVYNIIGAATMVGNLQIAPSGTAFPGMIYVFLWKAVLDTVTNGTTITIFGQNISSVQAVKQNTITCTYNGSTWDVDLRTHNTEAEFIETLQLGLGVVQANNIANGAITSTLLSNGSVTLAKLAPNSVDSSKIVDGSIATADLADGSVTTLKVADANITTAKIVDLNVTTPKINDLAVTTAKIADGNVTAIKLDSNSVTTVKIVDANVTTAKLADDSVTNDKLAAMLPSSLKVGDSSGNPIDLAIPLDNLPIGNGTGVTTIPLSSLMGGIGQYEVAHVPISFEAGEQSTNRVLLPKCYIENIFYCVTKTIESTEDATVTFLINNISPTVPTNAIVPAALSIGGVGNLIFSTHPVIIGNINSFALIANKPTPGGKIIASIVYVRQ